MPTKPTQGALQLATQLDAGVLTQFRAYAAGRDETLRAALERAMRREMASPPAPVPDPPLPPYPPSAAPKRTRKIPRE